MCLVAFTLSPNPSWRFVLAANRDEYLDRPTAPLTWWPDSSIVGGRDLRSGGSWMAMSRSGRFAAVTNFRLGNAVVDPNAKSRGDLVLRLLSGGSVGSPNEFAADRANDCTSDNAVAEHLAQVGPCNLLWGDLRAGSMHFSSNQSDDLSHNLTDNTSNHSTASLQSSPVYGLSNGKLDADWPKTSGLKISLARAIEFHQGDGRGLANSLFDALADDAQAPDAQLPTTGVSLEFERILSARFIATPAYGTRSSTVILVDNQHSATIIERTWDHAARALGRPAPFTERMVRFQIN